MSRKRLVTLRTNERQHWVGDGFPVRSLFSYNEFGQPLSPFLLLDRAGPHVFTPTQELRGVGEHPHRGFETVTIIYAGSVSHRDSAGGGGTIGPGDVQWMTAGSGLVHEEFHTPEFAQRGGLLDMVQLWVNLPAKDKMTSPKYQSITDARIPVVNLPNDAGRVRVIAGEFGGAQGPAHTFSPINVWDLRLRAGKALELAVPEGHSLAVVVLHGNVVLDENQPAGPAQFAVYSHEGSTFSVQADASEDAVVLVLSGQPLNEPINGYGPFVMNTRKEIVQAVDDYNSGQFGNLPVAEG